jgi:hypothetical protein
MSKTVTLTESDLKKTIKGYHGIKQEIANLTKELKAGTLDRKKLEAGLTKLKKSVGMLAPHPCE